MHRAANELRDVVGNCFAGLAAIEQNKDLVPEARKRKKHELARQILERLEESTTVDKARDSVASQMAKWGDKVAS